MSNLPYAAATFPTRFCIGIVIASLTGLTLLSSVSAQPFPAHDQLPPPAETEEGDITIEEQLVFIRGSDFDDKIEIAIRDGRIRFTINGERSTLRDDDYPYTAASMGPEMERAAIIIAGYDGNDDIVIIDETDNASEELHSITLLVLGGPGNDRLVSDSTAGCLMVGGEGSDILIGGNGGTTISGGILSCPAMNMLLFATHYPDFEKDFLYGGSSVCHLLSQWFVRIEPVEGPTNVHQVIGNRHLTPTSKVPIASRQKGGFDVSPPAVFEDIRIEKDEVWLKDGCVNLAIVVNESMEMIDTFPID